VTGVRARSSQRPPVADRAVDATTATKGDEGPERIASPPTGEPAFDDHFPF